MSCVNCYHYDSSYKGGYCDMDGLHHDPYDNCSSYWDDSQKDNGACSCKDCYYFDSYRGGYCNLSKMAVYPNSNCSSFTE